MNERLMHDAAMAMAQAMLDIVEPCLRYEERLEAIGEFYIACKAGIEAYEIQKARLQSRLNPTNN
jgi:hypothetical protein